MRILKENCFCLTPKRVHDSLNRIRKIGDNSDPRRADIYYEYDEIDGRYFIIATVGENITQRIVIETLETSFGEREYFRCEGCDSRCHKLFLLPGGYIFRCKSCHGIKYQSFNTSSRHGKLFDRTKKVLRLVNEQAGMTSRIWYRDNYTKRYSKFLNDCLKIGLTDIVNEARTLERIIKEND